MFISFLGFALSNLIYFALQITGKGSFPRPLSTKEELDYLKRYKAGDMEARGKLIEHNLRLVAHVIKKYYGASCEQDDLISIGTIGLIKAVSTFNYEKGTRLATYAARCIENEILMYFRNIKKNAGDIYISDPIDADSDGNTLSLIDVICDSESIEDNLENQLQSERLYQCIAKSLTDREKKILYARYGLGGRKAYTQREVARSLNISRSYVSRIEKKALEKLRKHFDDTV